VEKIAEGKLQKFFKENCLISQQFIKDTSLSIQDVLNETVGKTGEKISIKRFARFQIGEDS
jgi:elongation factor Ts